MSSAQWVDAWNVSPRELVLALLRVFRVNTAGPTAGPADHHSQLSAAPLAPDEERLIDPKGPRSFDETDADYFLRLLPGPRDREGLPEGARSWKVRIESQVATRTLLGRGPLRAVGLRENVTGPGGVVAATGEVRRPGLRRGGGR